MTLEEVTVQREVLLAARYRGTLAGSDGPSQAYAILLLRLRGISPLQMVIPWPPLIRCPQSCATAGLLMQPACPANNLRRQTHHYTFMQTYASTRSDRSPSSLSVCPETFAQSIG